MRDSIIEDAWQALWKIYWYAPKLGKCTECGKSPCTLDENGNCFECAIDLIKGEKNGNGKKTS